MKTTVGRAGCLGILCFVSACSPAKRGDEPQTKETEPPSAGTVIALQEDAVLKEIHAFRRETRQWYNARRFDDLEQRAMELRAAKAVFGNGLWKIQRFYDSLECADNEPESMWLLHKQIHEDWLAEKPASITARVAFADFWVSYAWHARAAGGRKRSRKRGGAFSGSVWTMR